MGRGFFSGLIWGALVCGVALVTLSQFSGVFHQEVTLPTTDGASDETVPVSDNSENAGAGTNDQAPEAGDAQEDGTSENGDNAGADSQTTETDEGSGQAETGEATTAAQPHIQTSATPLGDVSGEANPDIAIAGVDDTVAGGNAPQLSDPADDPVPAAGGAAALPSANQATNLIAAAPDAEGGDNAVGSNADASVNTDAPISPATAGGGNTPMVDFSSPQVVQPTQPKEQPTPQAATTSDVNSPGTSDGGGIETASETPLLPSADEPSAQPAVDVATADNEGNVEPDDTADGAERTANDNDGSLFKPVTNLVERDGSDNSARLPTIGGDVPEDSSDEPETGPSTGRALFEHAVPFDNPASRPVMAVILIGESGGDPSPKALPFVVTYGIDASRAGAAELATSVRNLGAEVAMVAPLLNGATPQDVEVAMQDYLARVTNAAVVLDVAEANFQASRNAASQMAEILAASGHGLVTYKRGLNAALQMADRADVPASLVFRVIDDGGRDRNAIKRFLDNAALRAGQQQGVIVVAHDRPETISALTEWTLGNRASTVTLAPLSAILKAQ